MRATTTAEYERRLAMVDKVIEENLDTPLSPIALAKVASFAPHHFHRIFRAQRGESVMQRIRRLRLHRAAKALSTSPASVLDIALSAGYGSHEAFTRAFSEQFGSPPKKYRASPSPRIDAWREEHRLEPMVDVDIRSLAPRRVLALRHHGPFMGVGSTFGALVEWALSRQLWPRAQVGLCPDDPELVTDQKLRMDCCLVLNDDDTIALNTEDPPLVERVVPGGRYAIALHRGSYATLNETYLDLIGRWLPTTDELPTAAPILEIYLNDPMQTKEADLETEVCLALAPK